MEKNEIVKITPELQEVVKTSGLPDLTKAEKIASNYAPFFNQVSEQSAILKTLKKGVKEDVEGARRVRIDLGKIASATEAQKKIDKEIVLIETRFIDSLNNTVVNAARLTQAEAKEIEDHFENIEKQRIQQLQIDRVSMLTPFYEDAHMMNLSSMDEEVFQAYFDKKKQDFEFIEEAKKQAELKRIKDEKQAEIERIAKEKSIALHNERKEKILPIWNFVPVDKRDMDFSEFSEEAWNSLFEFSAKEKEIYNNEQLKIAEENKRLKKEAEEQEAKAETERKKQAEINRKKQEEADKLIAAEKAKSEALEDELKAKKDEEERLKKEWQDKQEAEEKHRKQAEKAPVKDKMKLWVDSFVLPEISVQNEITTEIKARHDGFVKWAKELIEKL